MPELPEVETIKNQLSPLVSGAKILDCTSIDLSRFNDAQLAVGHTIQKIERRGKYFIINLDGNTDLIVHLGMTGSLQLQPLSLPFDNYIHVYWTLSNGQRLEFQDMRKFGKIKVVEAGDFSSISMLNSLGPEPLSTDFQLDNFIEEVNRLKAPIKIALLNQKLVAGIGNYIADEVLWASKTHPLETNVTEEQAILLYNSVIDVISNSIKDGGTTIKDYRDAKGEAGTYQNRLKCYGRVGKPCLRCSTLLVKIKVGGRGSTFCPQCQTING